MAPLEMFVSARVPPSKEFEEPRKLPEESQIPPLEFRNQGKNTYQVLNGRPQIFMAVFFHICIIKELWLLSTAQKKLHRQIKMLNVQNKFESILLFRPFLEKTCLLTVIQKDLPRSLTVLFKFALEKGQSVHISVA